MAQAEQQHGAEPRVIFNFYDSQGLADLTPTVQGRHWHGQTISLAVVRLLDGEPKPENYHRHTSEHALYCLRGDVEITAGDSQWHLGEGDALLLPAETLYRRRVIGDDVLLLYYFTTRQGQWGAAEEPLPIEMALGRQAALAGQPAAKPRLFNPGRDNTEQVEDERLANIPGTLELSHIYGQELSLGYFGMDKGTPYPAPHSHGEEIALQLQGTCTLHACDRDYPMAEGAIILIPPGVEHSGTFEFEGRFGDDKCLMVSFQTPPRYEWGPEQ